MDITIDKINGFKVYADRADADRLAAALTANEAGEPDAWTYKVRPFGPGFVVASIDENGFFAGHL